MRCPSHNALWCLAELFLSHVALFPLAMLASSLWFGSWPSFYCQWRIFWFLAQDRAERKTKLMLVFGVTRECFLRQWKTSCIHRCVNNTCASTEVCTGVCILPSEVLCCGGGGHPKLLCSPCQLHPLCPFISRTNGNEWKWGPFVSIQTMTNALLEQKAMNGAHFQKPLFTSIHFV